MASAGVPHEGCQVDCSCTPFLHAVSEQDQTVAGEKLELLDTVGGGGCHVEGEVGRELDLFDLGGAFAQVQRPGMPGVDQFAGTRREADAQQLTGGQAAAVSQQGLMGALSLLERVTTAAAGAAQSADQERGEQRGVGVVAHGVGDGQVQCVAIERVVVCVPADVVGRDQAGGEGELGASQQEAEGSSWCWISAARLVRVVRRPTWYRSVKRRSVTMM